MITVREYFTRDREASYYDVDLSVAGFVARSSVNRISGVATYTDEEIKQMISKTQKQKALEKRMIGASITLALDVVVLGLLWKRYRDL